MHRLKPVARTAGFLVLCFLAFVGLLSQTRGTPLRRVLYSANNPIPAVNDSSFLDLAELFSGMHFEPGNRVQLLLNGDGTYPPLWADLRAATRSITVQMYFSKPGAVADTMASILSERARAGVRTLLLLDAFGSQSMSEEWIEGMRGAGVEVRLLRKVRWFAMHDATERSHVRVVTVDGRVGYTGGFGLADYWLGNGRQKDQWRETNVRFEGPAVMALQAAFAAGWVEATGELPVDARYFPKGAFHAAPGGTVAALLFSEPATGSTNAERFLALTITGARRTLFVTNSYFVPDDDFRDLLVAAARRGVDVRILTTGRETDISTTWYAGRARYAALLRGGVRVWEYQPTMMHAKTVVADGVWSTVGSMNFDNRSLAFNNESNLVVMDQAFGAQLDSVFLADLPHSREILLEPFSRRPLVERIIEMSASALSRLL
jgi:cardiolipin synthase